MLSKRLFMKAEKQYRQQISDVLDGMICYQGPAYDQISEGFDAIRISLLQLNNFDDYLDFTRQISLFIKRAWASVRS